MKASTTLNLKVVENSKEGEVDNTPVLTNANPQKICKVCEIQFSKYTCPRCHTPYCSLPCYKNHSTFCTTAFYQSSLIENLKSETASEETKQKTLEILRRVHEEEPHSALPSLAPDTDLSTLLEQHLSLHPDADLTWDTLPPEIQDRFLSIVEQQDLSTLVQPWQPWWSAAPSPSASLNIKPDISWAIESDVYETLRSSMEGWSEDPITIPALSSLLPQGKQAWPGTVWAIVDVVFAYVLTLRVFNGDTCRIHRHVDSDDPASLPALLNTYDPAVYAAALDDAVEHFLAVSLVCSSTDPLYRGGCEDCLVRLSQHCLAAPALQDSRPWVGRAEEDVGEVFGRREWVVLALADTLAMLRDKTRRGKEQRRQSKGRGGEEARRVAFAERKVLFFLAFATERRQEMQAAGEAVRRCVEGRRRGREGSL